MKSIVQTSCAALSKQPRSDTMRSCAPHGSVSKLEKGCEDEALPEHIRLMNDRYWRNIRQTARPDEGL